MMRPSGSRNQRSKGGFRLKHGLQICLLLAICTWLLYQIKHSHDKKRVFEDKNSKINTKVTSKRPDLFDFGRKGSLPLVKENDSISKPHAKDDDSEEGLEEEGEQDQDTKQEEVEDEEVKRDGDDMIDELDQDRGDKENEQQEEFASEEEKDGQVEEDDLFDNEEHGDSAQEAREENYKRDDASSAVAHDSHVADVRGLDEEQDFEDSKVNDLEIAVNGTVDGAMILNNATLGYVAPMSNVSNVAFGENMTVTNADLPINGSHTETKELKVEFVKPENGSISSPVSTEVSNQKELQSTNTTAASLPDNNIEVTAIHTDSSLAIQNGSKLDDSVSTREIPLLGSSGLIPVQDQNSSIVVEHKEKSDASEGHNSEDHLLSSTTNVNGATTQVGTGGLLSQNAATAEKSETRIDLSTVPIIQNEVKHDDKVAE